MWHGWEPRYRPQNGDDAGALVLSGRDGPASRGGKKKPLAITHGDESDDSMPSLQTVSDSSDEEDMDEGDNDDDDDDEGSESDTSEGYDTDEEDALRDWLREAMDTAVASPDFYNQGPAPEFNALAEERKGNPFLKLLGSLRGMLSRSCVLVPCSHALVLPLLFRPHVLCKSYVEHSYSQSAPQTVHRTENTRDEGSGWGAGECKPFQAFDPSRKARDRSM